MKRFKYLLYALLIISSSILAATKPIVGASLYVSNNTGEILPQEAFECLIHNPQVKLTNRLIDFLQVHHVQQGRLSMALGMYVMSTDGHQTSDNTAVFTFSPYQKLSAQDIFNDAKKLSVLLNQDSVAVFIPNKQQSNDSIQVNFTNNHPLITKLIKQIVEKLPASYARAYSVTLEKSQQVFGKSRVITILWLGSHLNKNVLQKAFPHASIIAHKGTAYLVYQSGRVDKI